MVVSYIIVFLIGRADCFHKIVAVVGLGILVLVGCCYAEASCKNLNVFTCRFCMLGITFMEIYFAAKRFLVYHINPYNYSIKYILHSNSINQLIMALLVAMILGVV